MLNLRVFLPAADPPANRVVLRRSEFLAAYFAACRARQPLHEFGIGRAANLLCPAILNAAHHGNHHGVRTGPINGTFTGLAMPWKMTTPWPAPSVCSASSTLPSAAG